jgi:predicted neutral ceramidase superfamily lipid hydrolase
MWLMADNDLKRIDYDEWKKQIKSNAYVKLFSRVIWGLFLLSGFILNFQKVVALEFNLFTVLVLILSVSFIAWGISGFRREIKKLSEIK